MKLNVFIIIAVVISIASIQIAVIALDNTNELKSSVLAINDDTKLANNIAFLANKIAKSAEKNVSVLKLSRMVELSLDNGNDKFKIAANIRNTIYQNIPQFPTPNNFDFLDFDNAYLKSLNDQNVGHVCQGLAIIYASALESQGIPARFVSIFSDTKAPYDSHVSVEFWYDGKWYASDPTFNIMFKNGRNFISYSELYKLITNKHSYKTDSNGFGVFKNKSIDNYYIKLDKLLKYLFISPSSLTVNGKILNEPHIILPNTWDGNILRADGTRNNSYSYNGIYDKIYNGLLR